MKCDGTRAETRFRLSSKRTCPIKSAGATVQSTTGSRVVRISGSNGSNAGYTTFRGSVKGTGYPLHSSVSPSLPLPCVTVCHHISTVLYIFLSAQKHSDGCEAYTAFTVAPGGSSLAVKLDPHLHCRVRVSGTLLSLSRRAQVQLCVLLYGFLNSAAGR